MNPKNRTTQRIISTLILILVILPVVLLAKPKQADAQFAAVVHDPLHTVVSVFIGGTTTASAVSGSSNLGLHIKDIVLEVLKEVVRTIEKKLLQEMTKSMVNWINSGFHGSPLFLTNSDAFFKDIAQTEIKNVVGLFGYDPNKYPFGESFALNIINSYKKQFADNAAYSLNQVMSPTMAANYRNNFNYGGWNGFLINTQYQQNNYLGFQMMATDDIARRLAGTTQTAVQKVQTTLQQGMGFLSPQTCPSNPRYNNGINEFQKPSFTPPVYDTQGYIQYIDTSITDLSQQYNAASAAYAAAYNAQSDAAKAAFYDPNGPNVCPGGLKATTPGFVAANQIVTALGSDFRKTELGGAVGASIGAILDTLVNHFVDKGLNALAGVVNPPPAVDTWSYKGNTLISSTTNTPPPADARPGTCYTNIGGTALPNFTTQASCGSAGGVWVITAPSTTPPSGCSSLSVDGSYTPLTSITTPDNCTLVGGTWNGPADTKVTGCYSIDGTLALSNATTVADCSTAGGVWNGPVPGSDTGTGTCYNNFGGTVNYDASTADQCSAANGIWSPGNPPAPLDTGVGSCADAAGNSLPRLTTQVDCNNDNPANVWTSTNNP